MKSTPSHSGEMIQPETTLRGTAAAFGAAAEGAVLLRWRVFLGDMACVRESEG
jgi:hypothetical protein